MRNISQYTKFTSLPSHMGETHYFMIEGKIAQDQNSYIYVLNITVAQDSKREALLQL